MIVIAKAQGLKPNTNLQVNYTQEVMKPTLDIILLSSVDVLLKNNFKKLLELQMNIYFLQFRLILNWLSHVILSLVKLK